MILMQYLCKLIRVHTNYLRINNKLIILFGTNNALFVSIIAINLNNEIFSANNAIFVYKQFDK